MGWPPLSNTSCIADSSAGQPRSVSKTMRLALLCQFSTFSRSFPAFRHNPVLLGVIRRGNKLLVNLRPTPQNRVLEPFPPLFSQFFDLSPDRLFQHQRNPHGGAPVSLSTYFRLQMPLIRRAPGARARIRACRAGANVRCRHSASARGFPRFRRPRARRARRVCVLLRTCSARVPPP